MKNTRSFIHIHGQQSWCLGTTTKLFLKSSNKPNRIICCGIENKIFGDSNNVIYIDNTKKRSAIEHHLGTEFSALIFNCFNGFNPDLFCALAGLIVAPGIVIFITPDMKHWPAYADPDYSKFCSHPYTPKNIEGRYITYLIHKLTEQSESDCFFTLAQNSSSEIVLSAVKTVAYGIFNENTVSHKRQNTPNTEQKKVITSIEKLATTRTNGIITIYGNRGRGKSTAIGMALRKVGQIPKYSELKLRIVSQNKRNIAPIFEQLTESQCVDPNDDSLNFYPPDEFLRNKPACDLLIIDEAAAISLTVLKQLIEPTRKVIISSTIDGYEGTGMGLKTKLQTYFVSTNRSVNSFELTTPQRWELNDPVEKFIFGTFISHKNTLTENNSLSLSEPNSGQIKIEKIDRDVLSNDTQKVHQLFQLLALAHYRTTPDDLRYLLDAPDIELWVATHEDNICGVLMVNDEGRIDGAFEQDIWLGKRRLNGHLISQTLSSQSGFRQAIHFSYKRIVRIAVEEKSRRKGIASQLLNGFCDSISEQKQTLDFIGVSYGYEPILYKFWQTLNFKPIRTSHRENARSGLKSMIMLKPISMRAEEFFKQLENNFKQNLLFNLNHSIDKTIDSQIVNFNDLETPSKDHQQDQLDIYTFAFGNRQYLNCERSLYEFGVRCLNTESFRQNTNQNQVELITLKVLQKVDWTQSAKLLAFDGKKQILAELRTAYAILYNAVWGNKS